MAAIYVVIGDLDRTYTTATHPTLVQVNKYLLSANRKLTAWLNSQGITDTNETIKDVGIDLVENSIHNRKVKDNVEGYQFYRPIGLTLEMKDMIMRTQQWGAAFSFNPGNTNFI